jgi:hypothetical protein
VAEVFDHQALDQRVGVRSLLGIVKREVDAHARRRVGRRLFGRRHADHAGAQRERLVQVGDAEQQAELGADGERLAGGDERFAARDVLHVVGEKSIHALIRHDQLDRVRALSADAGGGLHRESLTERSRRDKSAPRLGTAPAAGHDVGRCRQPSRNGGL